MYGRREIGNETISWWSNGRAAEDNMESERTEDAEIGRKIRREWEGMVWENGREDCSLGRHNEDMQKNPVRRSFLASQ